jgi:hypothetical protein
MDKYQQQKMLIVDGLEFPGDLDEYLSYYKHLRIYQDLSSKAGYKISVSNMYKLKKVFEHVLYNQTLFLELVLPPYFAIQINNVWSLMTIINIVIVSVKYKDPSIVKRLHACARLYNIYYKLCEMISQEQNPKEQLPDLTYYIRGFRYKDFI